MVTNFEKIKNDMDIKQLAKVFKMKTCEECCYEDTGWQNCPHTACWCYDPKYYENWLNEEYKGEENV